MPKPVSDDPRIRARRVAIGQHLRALRLARGLSQTDLADLAGLERKAVQRIETAAVVPSLERILELADALAVPASEVLAGDPGPTVGSGPETLQGDRRVGSG